MPVRTSMADLIARVRRYIGDPAGTSQYFADEDVQDQLDEHRFTARYAPLMAAPTLQQGALYNYLDYYASVGNWESDEQLTWVNFATLTPATADRISGHWTFDLPAPGEYPPVYITGKFYDLNATAADLLEQWAAFLASTTYDTTADGLTFRRSQIVSAKQQLALTYRRKAMATSTRTRRTDLGGAYSPFSLGMGGPGDVSGDGRF